MATNPYDKFVRGYDYELFSLLNGSYYIVYYPKRVEDIPIEAGNFVHDGSEVETELSKDEFDTLWIKTTPYKTKYYELTVQLPPVDVVATKPTGSTQAAGSNAKILLLVVGVAAALILFNK
jgi:hypothetical protein